jgi:guanine deaminase
VSESRAQIIFAPLLNPRTGGAVDFHRDGAIACDDNGIITYLGDAGDVWQLSIPPSTPRRATKNILCPPFLDAHTHVPQHPIRGRFLDGITEHPPEGRLLAGLNKNVFPAEARCADENYAERVAIDFARDALAQGVVGGAAYSSIHMVATHLALQKLYPLWRVGLVLMEMNCPENLRLDLQQAERDMRYIAESFGERTIVTDRFAVAVGSDMRRMAAKLAERFSLRTQTHLNEQLREKAYVEKYLYPKAGSYTEVYLKDGLLDREGAILAHCIHNSDSELAIIAQQHAAVAHCPTSNTLLCSGVMPLDAIADRGIPYAICTDVGASPTMSMLAEMAQYLKIHAGRSKRATPSEALYRATLAPAEILGLTEWVGTLDVGQRMSLIEIEPMHELPATCTVDDAILSGLLGLSYEDLHHPDRRLAFDALANVELDAGPQYDLLDHDLRATAARLENRVISVTLDGWEAWRRTLQSIASAV